MKVKCVAFLDEDTGETLESSSWLTIGKEYHVLSVNMEDGLPIKFQLISDDEETPAYHDANQFEIVTNVIPEGWVVDFVSKSHFRLSPKAWSQPGFWEAYFDGELEAVELFNTQKNIILSKDE